MASSFWSKKFSNPSKRPKITALGSRNMLEPVGTSSRNFYCMIKIFSVIKDVATYLFLKFQLEKIFSKKTSTTLKLEKEIKVN